MHVVIQGFRKGDCESTLNESMNSFEQGQQVRSDAAPYRNRSLGWQSVRRGPFLQPSSDGLMPLHTILRFEHPVVFVWES